MLAQPLFTCSKLSMETPEQCVKYVPKKELFENLAVNVQINKCTNKVPKCLSQHYIGISEYRNIALYQN